MPHTAVEKRYRDNLNLEIEYIRSTIPSSALSRTTGSYNVDKIPGSSKSPCLSKASKAELIDGAFNHLTALRATHEQNLLENQILEQKIDATIDRLSFEKNDVVRWKTDH
jgi:hypothetical protein